MMVIMGGDGLGVVIGIFVALPMRVNIVQVLAEWLVHSEARNNNRTLLTHTPSQTYLHTHTHTDTHTEREREREKSKA